MLNTSNNSRIYASEYGYDRNNNVNKIGVIAGNTGVSMTYTYGTDNLPSEYTAGTNSGAYTYDYLNRLKSKTSSITPTVSYNYTSGTAMVSQELCDGVTITYFYDKNGNISSKKEGSNRSFYTYDEFNRLTIEQNEALNQTITYKYDAWGNIAMKKVYRDTDTLTPPSSKLIKSYDYVYSSSTEGMKWKDLMTEYDGKTITYDSIGNPTSYMGSTMYWEGRTLVEQIKNGTTITYSYDSSDMRTSKTVGGVKHNYYYVEGKLMYEDCPSYKLFYTYDANGFLSGIRRINSNGTTENFGVHCNIFGDVISVYYRDGSLAATYTYDSWGKLLAVTDMSGNDISDVNDIWTQNSIRYRGYVYDEETQLYYLQSRYYDPNTCRFINADDYSILTASPTVLSDKNLFAYCDCNPITRIDTNGDFWGAIIGGVIGGVTGAVGAAISGDNIWVGLGVGLATGAISGLVTDFAVASGGALWFAAAIITEGFCSATNYSINEVANDRDINWCIYAIEFGIGSITGALNYGISGGTLTKRSGSTLDNAMDDFFDYMTPKSKKVAGQVVKPTVNQCVKHTVKKIVDDSVMSVVISGGASLLNLRMTYWGK